LGGEKPGIEHKHFRKKSVGFGENKGKGQGGEKILLRTIKNFQAKTKRSEQEMSGSKLVLTTVRAGTDEGGRKIEIDHHVMIRRIIYFRKRKHKTVILLKGSEGRS